MSDPQPAPVPTGKPRRNTSGLKRGNNPGDIANANALIRQQEKAIDEAASSTPGDVIEMLFAEVAKFTINRTRKLNRVKGEIPRSDVEVLREARQLADRTFEIMEAKGRTTPALGLLAGLDSRLAAVATVLENRARPFHEPATA